MADERKVVTTLFCDLVGFAALCERADPEDVDAGLRRYWDLARRVIESYGGTVEKFIGDAVVGVFGAPLTHEDDAERAVLSGLRLVDEAGKLADVGGEPLRVRVGIETGEAVVRLDVSPGSGDSFLIGDAVNTAARLQAAASAMDVVVGARTYAYTLRLFDYEALPSLRLKGKRASVSAWRAVRACARSGIDTTREFAAPLIGRDAELRELTALFEAALSTGTPRSVLLVGEPGIGKTRLLAEFAGRLEAGPHLITWRQGRCPPYGEDVAFWALAEVVKEHAGIMDTDDVRQTEGKLEAAVGDVADRDCLLQRLRPLLGLDASRVTLDESFTVWRRFLEHLAARGPAVVAFEDLHWADDALLGFVEEMARRAEGVPLLLVATARPELFQRAARFADPSSPFRRIELRDLSTADTRRLARELLEVAAAGSPPGDIARIVHGSGGNPFYVEESVRLITDHSGALAIIAGRAIVPPGEDGDAVVPGSVQAVIGARLDALPAPHKAVLSDAAVVGEVFWDGAVAALGARERGAVSAVLNELVSRHLVRREPQSSMDGEQQLIFEHVLARDVAYGRLPRRARAAKHAAAAAWLETAAAGRLNDVADIVAYHYAMALDLARSAGETDLTARLVDPVVQSLQRAGQRALLLDPRTAERHLSAALALVADEDRRRPELLADRSRALFHLGRLREAQASLEPAVEGLLGVGETRAAAVQMAWLAGLLLNRNDPSCWDACDRAWALVKDDGPCVEQHDVMLHWAERWLFVGELERALGIVEEALALGCQLGIDEIDGVGVRGDCRLQLGDRRGFDDLRRVLASDSEGATDALIGLTISRLWFDGPRAALEAAEEAEQATREAGFRFGADGYRAWALQYRGWLGHWTEALADADEVAASLLRSGGDADAAELRLEQALLLARSGLVRQAQDPALWAASRTRELQLPELLVRALLAVAEVAAASGDRATAVEALDECCGVAPRAVLQICVARFPDGVRVALATGGLDLAERLVAGAVARTSIAEHALWSVSALMKEAREEWAAAADDFAAAADGWAGFEVPYEEARALLGRGRCLLALGRTNEAAASLGMAEAIFGRLGAATALAETRSVRGQTSPAVSANGR